MTLTNGTRLPNIVASDMEGNKVTLPESLAGRWSVVLMYRGHW